MSGATAAIPSPTQTDPAVAAVAVGSAIKKPLPHLP
jgi:hypothetical protein